MSWVAVLLLGIAVGDLVRSIRAVPVLPAALGGAAVVVAGIAGGLTAVGQVVALVMLAGVAVAWALLTEISDPPAGRAWPPLALLGAGLVGALVLGVYADPVGGAFGRWVDHHGVPALSGRTPTEVLLVLAVLLVQLSTGNVVVRLVLAATGTTRPGGAEQPAGRRAESELRGGRLLGPMERLFIVGLGLAGHVTAASIVIAAKGLIRWPELQSKRDAHGTGLGPDIDEVTEYFLVGSFVSWLVALGSLVLVG
jgi:hypothetical protein